MPPWSSTMTGPRACLIRRHPRQDPLTGANVVISKPHPIIKVILADIRGYSDMYRYQ